MEILLYFSNVSSTVYFISQMSMLEFLKVLQMVCEAAATAII